MSDTITLPREELERALKALQKTMVVWHGTCAWHADVKSAISTLSARLEQSEQKPELRVCCKDTDSDGLPRTLTCDPRCHRAQHEQRPEPVAWQRRFIGFKDEDPTWIPCSKDDAAAYATRGDYEVRPLYASPPSQSEQRPEPIGWTSEASLRDRNDSTIHGVFHQKPPNPEFHVALYRSPPPRQELSEEEIEAAFWEFDARRKGYGTWNAIPQSMRDAFKWAVRAAIERKVRG